MHDRHPTASMIVLDPAGGCVLLVRQPVTGLRVFPGGHLDAGEIPAEAALRAVRTETGVRATARFPFFPAALAEIDETWHPSPWVTAERQEPAGSGPPHLHLDQIFLGTAQSRTAPVTGAGEWVPLHALNRLPTRSDIPLLAGLAIRLLT